MKNPKSLIFEPGGGAALGSPTTAKVTIKASD
jgi:hypothetical protein